MTGMGKDRTAAILLLVPFLFLNGGMNGTVFEQSQGHCPTHLRIELPELEPWVLRSDGMRADWLGMELNGKKLLEPINLILIDPCSRTREESILFLERNLDYAGFGKKFGHSSGYYSRMNGEIFSQLPTGYRYAYADDFSWKTNHHGRFFGPIRFGGAYIYSASFSQESFQLFARVHHIYQSYGSGVGELRERLLGTGFFLEGEPVVDLDPGQEQPGEWSSGDHDGKMILLVRKPFFNTGSDP